MQWILKRRRISTSGPVNPCDAEGLRARGRAAPTSAGYMANACGPTFSAGRGLASQIYRLWVAVTSIRCALVELKPRAAGTRDRLAPQQRATGVPCRNATAVSERGVIWRGVKQGQLRICSGRRCLGLSRPGSRPPSPCAPSRMSFLSGAENCGRGRSGQARRTATLPVQHMAMVQPCAPQPAQWGQ